MTFQDKGYQIFRNFVDPDFVDFVQHYFFVRITAGHADPIDDQAPFSYPFYADPLVETILHKTTDKLGESLGIELLPAYTYTRLYGKHDELLIHRDRPSCEISATLALGVPFGEEINPIYFSHNEDGSNAAEIILNPGDLCVYRGCDLYHWRPKFENRWYLQAFLHFVDANGSNANNIYDGRKFLAMKRQ